VWQAHRVQRHGVTCVLLHCSAYGRYLAVSPGLAPRGHRGHNAIQRAYATPQQEDIVWQAEAVTVGGFVVRLRHVSNRLLRANGKYRRWNNGVSVDDVNNQSSMMHWVVQFVQTRWGPPGFPLPTPVSSPFPLLGSWNSSALIWAGAGSWNLLVPSAIL
jgi:hypothetical protein